MNQILHITKWFRRNIHNIFYVLDVVKLLGVLFLVMMFINFNVIVAQQAKDTKAVVDSQKIILDAIKDLAEDTKLTSEQKTNTIICMLQVPIEQRTQDVLADCREKSVQATQTGNPQAPTPKVQAP